MANRPAPTVQRTRFQLARTCKAMVHSDLVTIDQSSSKPAGNPQNDDANGHQEQCKFVRLRGGAAETVSDIDEKEQAKHIEAAVEQAARFGAGIRWNQHEPIQCTGYCRRNSYDASGNHTVESSRQ